MSYFKNVALRNGGSCGTYYTIVSFFFILLFLEIPRKTIEFQTPGTKKQTKIRWRFSEISGAYKKGKSAKSGKEGHKHKKKGVSKKGHVEQEHKGFAKGGGKKKYHKHHKDYHKKKGSSGGKQYGYQNEE